MLSHRQLLMDLRLRSLTSKSQMPRKSVFQTCSQSFSWPSTDFASSFLMSMESKTANTGPVAVTMSSMTVDMCGPAGIFGRLDLPEIRTSPLGTTITVTNQKIQIIDMKAFLEFNRASMLFSVLVERLCCF